MLDFSAIQADRLPALLHSMPKAELHIHIEGSLQPEMIFSLAQKNGIALSYPTVEALRAAYAFIDLQSFLDVYYAGASVLITEDDFYAMTMAYLEGAVAEQVVHAEIFFDPQTHTERGIPIGVVIQGIARACADARGRWGISSLLIMCFLRHLSEESAFETLQAALPYQEYLVGVGLDSGERGNPPEKFARVFAASKERGLRLVAHAGEEGPPAYIEAAMDVLQVERIDHGVRCTENPVLVQRLAKERTPLTVCPLSNIKLCVFERMEQHNLPVLLEAGLMVTVNSDDPAYFGGSVNVNFIELFRAHPELGARQAWQLAKNSIDASFASQEHKDRWLAQLNAAFVAAGARLQ
jgi:adenine deaminase